MKAKLPTFQYGARFTGDGKPAWIYWMSDADFRQELKLAFFDTKDLDKALDVIRLKVVQEVRSRVA